jgi:hypothetical protein
MPIVEPVGVIFTDAVALQKLALPAVLVDRVASVGFDAARVGGVGILNIRSVTTSTASTTTPGNIPLLADPGATTAAQRPARFMRIESREHPRR